MGMDTTLTQEATMGAWCKWCHGPVANGGDICGECGGGYAHPRRRTSPVYLVEHEREKRERAAARFAHHIAEAAKPRSVRLSEEADRLEAMLESMPSIRGAHRERQYAKVAEMRARAAAPCSREEV